jgi:heme-degrading monooxygenase HmoA
MHARMTTIQGSPDRLDAMAEQFEADVVPQIRELNGFEGYLLMGDRGDGRAMAITFWSSQEALSASEDAVVAMRQAAADTAGASSQPNVERFEVVRHQFG